MNHSKKFSNSPLLKKAEHCESFWKRLRGFMFRGDLKTGDSLFFPECNSIHTFFVKKPLKIIFLDEALVPVREIKTLPPRRFAFCKKAKHVLEIVV